MLPPPTTQEHAESHKNCGKCLLGCVFGSGRIFPPRHLKPGTATCRLSPLNVERLQSRQSQNGLAQSNTEQICPRQLICCREHDANPRIRVYCTFCLIRNALNVSVLLEVLHRIRKSRAQAKLLGAGGGGAGGAGASSSASATS